MPYDEYSDKLLAKKATIFTTTIFEILLGYPLHTLDDISRKIPSPESVDRKMAAKKLASESEYVSDSLGLKTAEANYLDLLHAAAASFFLKKWINLQFQEGEWFAPGEKRNTAVFFNWIDSDGIIKRLEEKVEGFKASKRAHNFIRQVKEEVEPSAEIDQAETGGSPSVGKAGRPEFLYEKAVVAAIKKLSKRKIKPQYKKDVPFHESVIAAFAPGQEMKVTEDTTKKEYLEITKTGYSTIYNLVKIHY